MRGTSIAFPARCALRFEGGRMTRAMVVFFIGLLAAGFSYAQASAAESLQVGTQQETKRADLSREPASPNTRRLADWIVDSGDNHGLPFVIVDKVDAKVFVFGKDGQLGGATPALVGLSQGDDLVPGVSGKKLSNIRPNERVTPAGRFATALGRNSGGQQILWVDYDAGIALHPVVTTNPKERRLQRLATPTPLDNRISYGCINVSAKFFKNIIGPAFAGSDSVVYILPEVHSINQVFPGYYEVGRSPQSMVSPPAP